MPNSVFQPARFERVHRVINEAASNPVRLSRSNDWFVTIDRSRADFADLGQVKPPSDAERKEIESGRITTDGQTQHINADFAQQTLLLARELHVSEHYAASLLQQGLAARVRWGRPAVEVACILFYRERLALLACLKDLLRNALTLPFEQDAEAQRMGIKMEQLVETLVSHEVTAATTSSKTRLTLPERVLLEIDNVKQAASRTRISLESGTTSNAPQNIQLQTSSFLGLGNSQTSQAPPSSTASSGRLSDEIQLERLGWLREEQRELGHILYLLSISSFLSTAHISAFLRWLANVSSESYDEMTIYVLTALLGALDTSPDARLAMLERASRSTQRRTVESLLDDESFVAATHADIAKLNWGLGELGSVVALQWSIFLVESFSRNSSFRNQLSISEEQIQDLVLQSITGTSLAKVSKSASQGPTGSALIFLVVRVLAFRQKTLDVMYGEEEAASTEVEGAAADFMDANNSDEEVDTEYREYVVQQIQNLTVGLTSIMLPMLRRIQRSEEDAAFAFSRGSNARTSVSVSKERRYDIEALFDLIALLCRGRSEAGLPFWIGSDNRITRFLTWAIDVREPGHQRALLNMLAAMSSGPQSASQAYALLDQESMQGGDGRLVSWSRFFEWITYYIDTFHQAVASGSFSSTNYHSVAMPKNEETLLIGFVRLFRNVVYFSSPARDALMQNPEYNALDRLFSLLTCPVPVELKANILDALAAFARNATAQGARFSSVAAQLWDRLDACGLVPMDGASKGHSTATFGSAFRPMSSKGVLYELENFEVPLRTFPGSTSFVNFLKALVQLPSASPKSVTGLLSAQQAAPAAVNPFSAMVPFDQQALQSSSQQRIRSIEPYVSFIVDHVLLKARTREYAEPAEQWRVVSSCLDFVDRSLRSYDLTALLNSVQGSDIVSDPAILTRMASHPGFFLMKRLLTGTNLVGELLGILVPGSGVAAFEAINQNRASTLFYGSSICHVLSILERVLRNQDLFAQVLIPTLIDASSNGVMLPFDVSARVGNSGAYSSFDLHLLHAHESVVQIALLVNCSRDDIALLSVRLLMLIAQTPAFSAVDRFGEMGYRRKMNRLVGLLEMSDEAGRVKAGYVGRLEAEPSPDANTKTTEALLALTSADVDDDTQSTYAGDAVEAIQIAILDLLLNNTEANQPAPNVAHLLLGYDLRAVRPEEQVISDPDSTGGTLSAIHAILTLLRHEGDEANVQLLPLAERSPVFAEKCYALILRLCTHSFTSAATLRYLRTQEDFVVQQMRSLSLIPAERGAISPSSAALGVVQYTDGQMLETTIDRVIASLRLRASLLDLTALELHALLNAGTQSRAARVVAALFGPNSTLSGTDNSESVDGDDLLLGTERDFRIGANGAETRTLGGVRFLEMLQSLDFEWYDDRETLGQNIHIVTPEQLEMAKPADAATGPRKYDLKAVLAVLIRERTILQQKGELRDVGQTNTFMEQATFVLQWASAQNAKKAVAFSRRRVLQAWRHALDMVLARATSLLRVEIRSSLIFDCLSVLLPRISAPSSEADLDSPSSDLVAGGVLSLLTSLRQHRVEMNASTFDLDSADALPVERLISTLRALVDSMLRLETTTLARGNLYSALINFLQLVKTSTANFTADLDKDMSSVIASDRDDTMSIAGFSTVSSLGGRAQNSSLEARTKVLLVSHAERLVDVLGRDALDASDLSKTIAFTLLDRLCALDSPSTHSSSRRGSSKSLDLMERKGYIQSFVTALRDSDLALQETLRPDPSSLNAIYVYEARLAFFNRLAQSREGAEKLLSARIFDTLAQADFLAARPDQDQDFVDLDSFLPAATERYNALLMPVLQLSVSILASTSLSSSMVAASTQSTYGISKALAPTSAHAAPRHVVTLLTAHRDAFLAVLRAPVQELCSFAQLSQAHLLVSMFVFVLPTLDDDAQQPPNPLAPFHSAILAFAATYLDYQSAKDRVVPSTEAEREEARLMSGDVHASSDTTQEEETAFDVKVANLVVRLQMTLLSYLEGASEARGGVAARTRPVLSPSLVSNRERSRTPFAVYDEADISGTMPTGYLRSQQRISAVGSHVPTLGTLVSAVEDHVDSVNRDLQTLENMAGALENVDGVRQDEVDENVRDVDGFSRVLGSEVTDMAPSQRRSVATRELRARQAKLKSAVTSKLDAIELALVLLIRHIEFFSHTTTADTASNNLLPTLLGRQSQRADTPAFQQNSTDRSEMMAALAETLLPIIEDKIGYLNLPANLVVNARERHSFLQMAGRRLASFFTTE